jgi:hypothetical protein
MCATVTGHENRRCLWPTSAKPPGWLRRWRTLSSNRCCRDRGRNVAATRAAIDYSHPGSAGKLDASQVAWLTKGMTHAAWRFELCWLEPGKPGFRGLRTTRFEGGAFRSGFALASIEEGFIVLLRHIGVARLRLVPVGSEVTRMWRTLAARLGPGIRG